jgi:hypothetical protein
VDSSSYGGSERQQYDASLHELALNQPSSFLQIGDLATTLDAQKAAAIAEVKNAGNDTRAEADKVLREALTNAVNEFKRDAPKAIWGTYLLAAGAVVAFALLMTAIDWTKNNVFPDSKKIARAEAEATLRERTMLPAVSNPAETAELTKRIAELNARIATLEKKAQ